MTDFWQLGNMDKNQLQLTTHFGFEYPMRKNNEVTNKMANLKENAKNYIPTTTLNIADLEKVSVNLELKNKIVHEGEAEEFSYDYIEFKDEEYRVPKSVLKQLKVQIEANDEFEFFSVAKSGEGMNTEYTVIPCK